MPFLAREHERVALGGGEGVHLLDGAAEDILLDALALAVEVAQLAGEPLGEAGALLAEIACERALAHCNRSDIPEEMEQAVAAVLVGLVSRESDVKSITRGDTSVTYLDGKNAESVLLAPWCRLGTLREG